MGEAAFHQTRKPFINQFPGSSRRKDLRRNRENGWALFRLMQALKAQGKNEDAALAEARFKKAWARADVTLTASRFGK